MAGLIPALGSNSFSPLAPQTQQALATQTVGTPPSGAEHMSQYGLNDTHFNPPDANGVRTFTQAGQQAIQSQLPQGQGLIPTIAQSGASAPNMMPTSGIGPVMQPPPPMSLGQASALANGLGMTGIGSTLGTLAGTGGAAAGAGAAGAAGAAGGLGGALGSALSSLLAFI